jgi:threonine/homoserine/homoserine lactone efflux protein
MNLEPFLSALAKGIAIGFTLAVPLGPIGVLCIRRTLTEGRRSAVSTMLGAASADSVYGMVAAFGVTLVSDFVADHTMWFRLVGGAILIVIGIKTFRTPVATLAPRLTFNAHAGNFVTTFLLTLTNPLTLFAFAAVFAGADTVREVSKTDTGALLVGGVFLGSLLWFSSLVTASYLFRAFLLRTGLDLINRITGVLITLFGAVALFSSLA